MTVTVISVGTVKESYITEAVAEYEKRIRAYSKIENISIKEERLGEKEDKGAIEKALRTEGEKILSAIPDGAFRIALCVEGRMFSSEELAEKITEASGRSGKICFIIGSSYGLSDHVKQSCDLLLSVSPLTFPHQLMRVILAETLYRSLTISAGKKYHK